jgi:hypothetical protein
MSIGGARTFATGVDERGKVALLEDAPVARWMSLTPSSGSLGKMTGTMPIPSETT